MKNSVARFCKREDGPTAVEYAVIAGLIIVVCVAAIAVVGSNTNSVFTSTSSSAGSGP
jgi:pilus assembly protein Flp/PilA